MAKIKFERTSAPTGSVEFTRNPSITGRGLQRKKKYFQPIDYSDGGDVYIYNKGITKDFVTLTWNNNAKTDYTNLMTFIGVVVGAKYNFTYYDSDGLTHTARIINSDNLQSSPVATNRESFSVELLLE